MRLNLRTTLSETDRRLDDLSKQGRFALAVALTGTGQDVRSDLRDEMPRVFDRPTRYTLNSLFLQPATKDRLEARVWVKDSERPSHYLLPEIEGGRRMQKRFEELLRQRGILSASERTVPGAGAKLDSHGNMSRAQITQILSQLKAFNLAGASQNATDSPRSRAKRKDAAYFVARKGESRVGRGAWKTGEKVQHLDSGIYVRTSTGIKPVLIFVDSATYAARFPFFILGQRTVARRFPIRYEQAYARAFATARWSR